LCFISDFSWKGPARSVVSDEFCLVASLVADMIVLWNVIGGTIHHTFSFGEPISAIAFDEAFGLWIATESQIMLISVNNEMIAKCSIDVAITTIAPVILHSSRFDGGAICGTEDGSVVIARADFRHKVVDTRVMTSEHRTRIENVVVHPSRKSFVTVDQAGVCCQWIAVGLGSDTLRLDMYRHCHVCGSKASVFCQTCRGATCRACLDDQSLICALCVGLDAY
jgi:hypothetical protein